MKQYTILFSILVFALLFIGCEEKIDLDLDDIPPAIVIEGRITNGNILNYVRISQSSPYLSPSGNNPVVGALVTLTEDGIYTDTLKDLAGYPGRYDSDLLLNGKIGSTYTLRVYYGGEVYEAEDMIRPVTPLDSLTYQYDDKIGDEDDGYYVWLHAQEPVGVGNFYQWMYISNGETLGFIEWVASDEWVDGNYISLPLEMDEPQEIGDTVVVEMAAISQQYFTFVSQLLNQESFGDLFDTPPANVKGNFSNGAFGYFNAAGVVADTIVIE